MRFSVLTVFMPTPVRRYRPVHGIVSADVVLRSDGFGTVFRFAQSSLYRSEEVPAFPRPAPIQAVRVRLRLRLERVGRGKISGLDLLNTVNQIEKWK